MFILNSYSKATISVKIIDKGDPTKLKFGKNRDLDFILISSTNPICDENFEAAQSVFIRNGKIIESECGKKERLLVLSTFKSTNIPKMISFPGEHFLSFKKLKFKFLFNICNFIFFIKFEVN